MCFFVFLNLGDSRTFLNVEKASEESESQDLGKWGFTGGASPWKLGGHEIWDTRGGISVWYER